MKHFLFAGVLLSATQASAADRTELPRWWLDNRGQSQSIDLDDITRIQVPGVPGQDVGLLRAGPVPPARTGPVRVAVLDTGVDLNHPDLKDKLENPGWSSNHQPPQDTFGHGTHVAGIVAAFPDVKIIPVRVIDTSGPKDPVRPQAADQPGPVPSALADQVAQGLDFAVRAGAEVVNLSMAWPQASDTPAMRQALELARSRHVLVVASAGNDSNSAQVFPCAAAGVICVAAHGPDGALLHFSNYGPAVDLAAPGLQVLSTWPLSKDGRGKAYTGRAGYELKNGTSMAAPMVAGLAARLLSLGIPPDEVVARLLVGARPVLPNPLRTQLAPAKWVRSGNADLVGALHARPQPLILPASKAVVRLAWDRLSRRIPLRFELRNAWAEAPQGVRLDLALVPLSAGSAWARPTDASVPLGPWPAQEVRAIQTELEILDPRVEGRLELEVTARVPGLEPRAVRIPIEISVPVSPDLHDPEVEQLPVEGTLLPGAQLRSVTAWQADEPTEFLALQRGTGLWKLQRLTETEGRIQVSGPVEVALPGSELFLVQKLPGRSGYALVFRLPPQGAGNVPRFAFQFLDAGLQPAGNFVFDNTPAALTERFQWISRGGQFVPAWVNDGLTPALEQPDRKRDPWHRIPPDSVQRRLYWLDRQGGLHTQDAPEGARFVALLDPDQEQRNRGQVLAVLARGQGYPVKNFTALVSEGAVSELQLLAQPEYRNLLALPWPFQLRVQSLDRSPSEFAFSTSFAGPSIRGALRATWLSARPGVPTRDWVAGAMNPTESALMAVGAFDTGSGRRGLFTLTQYEVQFHDLATGQVRSASQNRFSYLPVLTQNRNLKFFPVPVEDSDAPQGLRLPGLLIPPGPLSDTPAHEVLAPLYDAQGALLALARPARLRLQDTEACSVLGNPRPATAQSAAALMFFCGDRFLRIPLQF